MEATRTCPSCGALVPEAARRCKECFHDFVEEDKPQRSKAIFIFLIGIVLVAGLAAVTLSYITSFPADEKVLVDDATKTIKWLRTFKDGRVEAEQVSFDQIARIEYINSGAMGFQVVAVTTAGERKTVESSTKKPLLGQAQRYSDKIKVPLQVIGEPGVEGPEGAPR